MLFLGLLAGMFVASAIRTSETRLPSSQHPWWLRRFNLRPHKDSEYQALNTGNTYCVLTHDKQPSLLSGTKKIDAIKLMAYRQWRLLRPRLRWRDWSMSVKTLAAQQQDIAKFAATVEQDTVLQARYKSHPCFLASLHPPTSNLMDPPTQMRTQAR